MEELLREILSELKELNESVGQIAAVMPATAPLYDLDDIYSKMDDVADQIKGTLGYDLSDLHQKLSDIDLNTA